MFRFYPLKKGLVVGELGGENFSIGKFRLYSIVQLKPLKFYHVSTGRGKFFNRYIYFVQYCKEISPSSIYNVYTFSIWIRIYTLVSV